MLLSALHLLSPHKTKDCDTIGLQGGFIPSKWLIKKGENATMKRAGEKVSQIVSGRKRMHFFGDKILQKMDRKEQCRKRKGRKGLLKKLVPIIYVKESCYETPLYDHVLGDKMDSDKDEV